uniref:Uncharacterized protein n=1 Tax=Arundo donax TaxID=35708 RepID=A0A0A9GIG2_ARUDO
MAVRRAEALRAGKGRTAVPRNVAG